MEAVGRGVDAVDNIDKLSIALIEYFRVFHYVRNQGSLQSYQMLSKVGEWE